MSLPLIPIWRESPFLRLLPPLITGILLQWYVSFPASLILISLLIATLALPVFHVFKMRARFRLYWLPGLLINLLIVAGGCGITYCNHPQNTAGWLPAVYSAKGQVKAVLQEPLTRKNQSFKALAAAQRLYINGRNVNASGNIILYFSEPQPRLSYGSIIIINKPLIPVKNSGNPGAFDYKRFCTFAQTAYQVHLKPGDFTIIPSFETRGIKKFIFNCREFVMNILHKYIGQRESALADALLIGYKDEIDKPLLQAYSNTGVIHVIAVSGMHLGLIYFLLAGLMKPFARHYAKWLSILFTLAGLWIFSLMAGAGPSVIRSAVMFSFIVIGNAFSKHNSIYNNLAASAFLLLCWNPFWLWDIGFQLSYAAVLSIVIFYRPVYNLLYVRNKILDAAWKLNVVTISAQLLTTPLAIYHFHQFPMYFLPANMIAVPLSSALLLGEILLCAVSFIPPLASWTGTALTFMINLMNDFIDGINQLPFASWTHLQLSWLQVLVLFACIAAAARWLFSRNNVAFVVTLSLVTLFICLRTYSFITAGNQCKIIVYNVPRGSAIDLVDGRSYYYLGDDRLQKDPAIRNFHLEPSRILHRISETGSLDSLPRPVSLVSFHGKKILMVNGPVAGLLPGITADMLVLSGNPTIQLPRLLQNIQVEQVIADGSNSYYSIQKWEQDCRAAHILFHSTAENGAFILMCD